MVEFDAYADEFVPPSSAPAEAKLTGREFQPYKRPGSRLPVYRFPPVAPNGGTIDRYLRSDLHMLASGALL